MTFDFNMKTRSPAFLTLTLIFAIASAHAQFGNQSGSSQGLRFNGAMAKFFGDNTTFSASVEMDMKGGSLADSMKMPGKLAVADGKSRFEMDVTQIKSSSMSESAQAQMKSMGMDKMVMISRPDSKVSYLIYPNLQAHAETSMPENEAAEKASKFKIETTELGKETVDGHPCVKVKAVVTDDKGVKTDATLWKATDLKDFPVKLEKTESATLVTMLFKDVKFAKPDAKMFEPPADSTKYAGIQELMQGAIAKRLGGGQGGAPKKQDQ
jgi:hypothetical protein